MLRSVAVFGVLGIAMVIVVIGRGIDLSIVANMAISVAWTFQLANEGVPMPLAIALGLGFALLMSLIVGILIAYAEIPPLFATLAMGTFIYGFGRAHMILGIDVVYLPRDIGWLRSIGQGFFFGIPSAVILAIVIAFAAFLLLRYTKPGRFIYAMGDNYAAARVGGVPVRPVLVFQYLLAGLIAYIAGVITATSVAAMNTRIVTSNLVYDIILVVVLGGVGLERRQGRRSQRRRRHVADRHSAERHDDHGHPVHRPEPDQEFDSADRHHRRQRREPSRRANRPAGRHLTLHNQEATQGGNGMRIWKTLLSTAVAGLISSLTIAQAQEMSDTFRTPALDAMKGKTIAYLPISLGFDLAQAWGGVVKEEANHYGMKFVSQDPNWSTDAMAQALTNLIAQKPDVIVTQNPDLQSLARLLKQANAQGIYVIQANMQGAVQTDAFVGPDLIGMGEEMGKIVVNSCGKNGKSNKVAIVQGVVTGGVSFFEVQGVKKVLAEHPDIQLVSSQAADWDASKARSITETVLQQNPDLCAIVDVWDGQARGTGAAIQQAGQKGQGDAGHRRWRCAEHVRCPFRRNVRLRDQL